MFPLVVLALIIVIVGVLAMAIAADKTPGIVLSVLGFLLGGGAFFVMYRGERGKKKQA